MIRLLILALGVFLIWVLFFSGFTKQRKITISIIAVLIAIGGLWFEQRGQNLKSSLIAADQIADCGASATHTYRTNFDVRFCLQNNASKGTAKRVAMRFIALNCQQGDCQEIESVDKDIRVQIAPGEQATLVENLSFARVDPNAEGNVWTASALRVGAIRDK